MESEITNMVIENVKINKKKFIETYIHEEWLRLLQECHSHCQKDKKGFICVYCHCKNSTMWINEH